MWVMYEVIFPYKTDDSRTLLILEKAFYYIILIILTEKLIIIDIHQQHVFVINK